MSLISQISHRQHAGKRTRWSYHGLLRTMFGVTLLGLFTISSCVSISSCRRPKSAKQRGLASIVITDDHGHQVTLPKAADRIASLSPSSTEVLFAIGCGKKIILRDKLSSFPPSVRSLPATNPFQLSPEHIAGFSPDLVLLSHTDSSRTTALRRIGLRVAIFDPRDFEGIYRNIQNMGTLCDSADEARRLVDAMQARVYRVTTAVKGRPRPRVYIEVDGTDPMKPWTAGPGSFVDQLLTLAGGKNIAGRTKRPFSQLSAEIIIKDNPDHIVTLGVDTTIKQGLKRFRARAGWRDLPAVREGRVDQIHADLLSRPGPRLVDGLEALARVLHPKAFAR